MTLSLNIQTDKQKPYAITEQKLRISFGSLSNIWYEKPCSTILQKSGTWVQLIRELLSHELTYDMKKLLNKEGSSTK